MHPVRPTPVHPILARRLVAPVMWTALLLGCGGPDPSGANNGAGVDPDVLHYSPVVEWERYDLDGFPVRQFVPPEPKGLVFVFHGSNGTIGFTSKLETVATLNALSLAGIGFVATESDNRETGQWDLLTTAVDNNPDLTRLADLYDHVLATTEVQADTPLFALGFSNGGAFSGVFALAALEQGWPIAAVFPHLSGCGACYGSPVPTAFVEAINDPRVGVADVVSEHLDRGVPARHLQVPEQPVTPDFFTKNPAVSDQRSQNTFDELVTLALIDGNGNRIVPVEEAEQWADWYGTNGTVNGADFRAEELKVAWALHRMNAHCALEVRDFALEQL